MLECLLEIAEEINEELESSRSYMWKAIKHKYDCPDAAKKYCDMAHDEQEHAETLYEIGECMLDGCEDEYCESMWKSFAKPMMESTMVKIKAMNEVYDS